MPNVMNCVVDRRHRREADAEEQAEQSGTDDGMKVRDGYFVRRQPKPAGHFSRSLVHSAFTVIG
jgi:hypothetical protein